MPEMILTLIRGTTLEMTDGFYTKKHFVLLCSESVVLIIILV